MKTEKDYFRDLAQIRSMMERSSKFLSLSGWAGIMAGVYALVGAYIAHYVLDFRLDTQSDLSVAGGTLPENFRQVILLAVAILTLAVGTAMVLSSKNAKDKGEKAWNPTSKRLIVNMAFPLVSGGILMLIFYLKRYDWIGCAFVTGFLRAFPVQRQ